MQDQYELEPDIDGDLVDEVREYSLRKDGKYVEGVVTDMGKKNGRIALTVEMPMTTFTDVFNKPTPVDNELEQVANEYGQGLVDIGALVGETVWCEKRGASWDIAIRRGRLGSLKERFSSLDSDTMYQKFVLTALAPMYMCAIWYDVGEAQRWSHKSRPSNEAINWMKGMRTMTGFILFWLTALFVGLVLLI